MKTRVWVAWSSGKDSALVLARLHDDPTVDVVGLLTTVDAETDSIPLHRVPVGLVRAQAVALHCPVHLVPLTPDDAGQHHRAFSHMLAVAREAGVEAVAFGDIHLEWARQRRRDAMEGTGVDAMFPLWGVPPAELADEIIERQIDAVVTCVDSEVLGPEWLGRPYDHEFLTGLPSNADPCGENGEFHTFVTAHPLFDAPLDVHPGETHHDERYPWLDLLAPTIA